MAVLKISRSSEPRKRERENFDLIRQSIATLGENIGIGRFARLATSEGNGFLQTYIHPPGKLGVMVEFQVGKPETREDPVFQMFGRDVAMHIAAAAPGFAPRARDEESLIASAIFIARSRETKESLIIWSIKSRRESWRSFSSRLVCWNKNS